MTTKWIQEQMTVAGFEREPGRPFCERASLPAGLKLFTSARPDGDARVTEELIVTRTYNTCTRAFNHDGSSLRDQVNCYVMALGLRKKKYIYKFSIIPV